jgi:hypothetical protein
MRDAYRVFKTRADIERRLKTLDWLMLFTHHCESIPVEMQKPAFEQWLVLTRRLEQGDFT